VEGVGRALVPARVLSNLLANLPEEQKITLATSGDHLVVSTPKHSSLIKNVPDEDFPSLPGLEDATVFTAESGDWLAGLRAVAYAASASDIKPEIASVYLHVEEGQLVFVATDSFRLAAKKTAKLNLKTGDLGLLIPIRNVGEIVRVLESIGGAMEVAFSKHQLVIRADGVMLTSRLIDGIFPDYKQIIPKGASTSAVLAKTELANALKIATVFSDRLSQISLKIGVSDNLLELSATQSEVGESTTQIEAQLEGEDITVSFNLRYLLDCLPFFSGPNLRLSFNGKNRPILVTDESDASLRYLIMPLNR
jgi:DNA polymerase-3 subunit beta